MELQTIIFIGRSGSGKGTQLGLLKTFLDEITPGVPVLAMETGKYFREYIGKEGYTWSRSRALNSAGERQPEFLAVWVWASVFIEKFQGNEHLMFDGTPRSLTEAQMLHTLFPFYGRTKPTVVFLNTSRGWVEERLRSRGRSDDVVPGVIDRKLSWYEKDVVPAIEFYRSAPEYRFLDINGEQAPEVVHEDILKGLGLK
ncbi:MAG: nucleoside monophosphate kinase [Patescibacteria group bacterium]